MFNPVHRKPDLLVHSSAPFNAEPPLARLRAAFVTPQHLFYVRTHGTVPRLDEARHRLLVGGAVATPLDLSMADLRARFVHRTVPAVLQCAGNRRADLRQVRPVSGDPWNGGAIGHAAWTGVPLRDVLHAAGADGGADRHVILRGLDDCEADGERFRYEVSIPLSKALAPEVLLAWAMNGEPLAPEHGFPLRAVVPGYAGARSPKWLSAVTVADGPSTAHPQARDYKLFPPDIRPGTADWTRGLTINDMPLNAAICDPAPGTELPAGPLTIRGWAVAAAGRPVARVDVSTDGGRTWAQAQLEHDAAAPWSWTFWAATLDIPKGDHELAVRAWDTAGQTQPALPDDTWNFKGYLNNSWHRVRVRAV